MAKFIKIKQIIISQGQNKLTENDPVKLNDFLDKRMKVSIIKTRNCTVILDRLPSEQTKRTYNIMSYHNSNHSFH